MLGLDTHGKIEEPPGGMGPHSENVPFGSVAKRHRQSAPLSSGLASPEVRYAAPKRIRGLARQLLAFQLAVPYERKQAIAHALLAIAQSLEEYNVSQK